MSQESIPERREGKFQRNARQNERWMSGLELSIVALSKRGILHRPKSPDQLQSSVHKDAQLPILQRCCRLARVCCRLCELMALVELGDRDRPGLRDEIGLHLRSGPRALHTRGDFGGGRQAAHRAVRGKYCVLNAFTQVELWATWTCTRKSLGFLSCLRGGKIVRSTREKGAGIIGTSRLGACSFLLPFLSPVTSAFHAAYHSFFQTLCPTIPSPLVPNPPSSFLCGLHRVEADLISSA
jgi:hypothetical protein